jgi:vanillate/3-O-methylgallate O-demethylase
VKRTKVTLVLNANDVRDIFGSNPDYTLSYARYRVECRSNLAGVTFYCAYIHPEGSILGLALVENQYAAAGTEVTVLWGENPGPGVGSAAGTNAAYHRIRATVQPAPYNEFARTQYRKG